MSKHRTHSVEIKRQVSQEYLSGETLHGLSKRHNISRNLFESGLTSFKLAYSMRTSVPPICLKRTKHG